MRRQALTGIEAFTPRAGARTTHALTPAPAVTRLRSAPSYVPTHRLALAKVAARAKRPNVGGAGGVRVGPGHFHTEYTTHYT
jgi:hypothetical protein